MKRDVKPGFLNPSIRPLQKGADGWATAVLLTERWLARRDRVDVLLEGLAPGLPPQERARAQHLFYGVVRWTTRIESALEGLMTRPPRTKVRALLLVAGFEVLEQLPDKTEGAAAKIVHHAVERAKTLASAKEAGLINAVARKMAARLAETTTPRWSAEIPVLAQYWAHPEWLVTRWHTQFGPKVVTKLLEWNQQPAPVYARWRTTAPVPEFLTATNWPGFYEVKGGHWDEVRQLVQAGQAYLQDPSTRLSLELLAPQAGETILDACAAPGGKSLMIADAIGKGRLVALDEPGPRLDRLRENLTRAPAGVDVSLMPGDLTFTAPSYFKQFSLPESYDAVLVDAPCSNTGVMRHRIDVKWRLQEGDFAKHADQQLALLHGAARLVAEGGRMVYSTCSLEGIENEGVIKAFFASRAGGPFRLERQILAYPWVDGHDGAGAFLLRRT